METGVIIRYPELFPEEIPGGNVVNVLKQLAEYNPGYVILDIGNQKEMHVLELFSKLEDVKVFPFFSLGSETPNVMAKMVLQAQKELNTPTVYLGARLKNNVEVQEYFKDFLTAYEKLDGDKEWLWCNIVAPARNFLEENSLASWMIRYLRDDQHLVTHPVFMVTSSPESLSVLKNKKFQSLTRNNEFAEFFFQVLLRSPAIEMPDLTKNRIYFWGLSAYSWYRVNQQKELAPKPTFVATAKIIQDNVSGWSGIPIRSEVACKYKVGDPDLKIVEILPGDIGKTLEGQFIRLELFEVTKL